MRRKKLSEVQILGMLKAAEACAEVRMLCRKHGVSDATYYNGKVKYAGMTASEARRLREFEHANAKLKKLLAEAAPDKAVLKELLSPRW